MGDATQQRCLPEWRIRSIKNSGLRLLDRMEQGMYQEGLATCQKVVSLCGSSTLSRALSSVVLAMTGKTHEAKEILSELKHYQKLDSWSLILLAETCTVMGGKTEAFEFLEMAYQQRGTWLIFLGVMPTFRNIRTDPRYADLLRRMGLPEVSLLKGILKEAKAAYAMLQ
jgi:hypothetical protein